MLIVSQQMPELDFVIPTEKEPEIVSIFGSKEVLYSFVISDCNEAQGNIANQNLLKVKVIVK